MDKKNKGKLAWLTLQVVTLGAALAFQVWGLICLGLTVGMGWFLAGLFVYLISNLVSVLKDKFDTEDDED